MTGRRVTASQLRQTEAQWQTVVVDYARLRGWLLHHGRPLRTVDGEWRTAITGDRGFPDLVMVRRERLVVAELKSETGRAGPGQAAWAVGFQLVAAASGGAVEFHHWRPSAWPEVERVLL